VPKTSRAEASPASSRYGTSVVLFPATRASGQWPCTPHAPNRTPQREQLQNRIGSPASKYSQVLVWIGVELLLAILAAQEESFAFGGDLEGRAHGAEHFFADGAALLAEGQCPIRVTQLGQCVVVRRSVLVFMAGLFVAGVRFLLSALATVFVFAVFGRLGLLGSANFRCARLLGAAPTTCQGPGQEGSQAQCQLKGLPVQRSLPSQKENRLSHSQFRLMASRPAQFPLPVSSRTLATYSSGLAFNFRTHPEQQT